MCGRFYIDEETVKEVEKIAGRIDRKRLKLGDVHPSEPALVLKTSNARMVPGVLKWGYEAAGKNGVIFNARSESVQEKPIFRNDYESRRCIIPARRFYEWKKTGPKQKEKYDFFSHGEILFLAGIYHKDPAEDRFTILTREAEGCMAGIHNRMPVILDMDDIPKWLFSQAEAENLLGRHFDRLERKRSVQEEYRQMSLF